jgi:hypothetical protein
MAADPDAPEGAHDPAHEEPAEEAAEETDGETRQARAPWHFKVIAVGSVVYLGYRLFQGITWLVHHL